MNIVDFCQGQSSHLILPLECKSLKGQELAMVSTSELKAQKLTSSSYPSSPVSLFYDDDDNISINTYFLR